MLLSCFNIWSQECLRKCPVNCSLGLVVILPLAHWVREKTCRAGEPLFSNASPIDHQCKATWTTEKLSGCDQTPGAIGIGGTGGGGIGMM